MPPSPLLFQGFLLASEIFVDVYVQPTIYHHLFIVQEDLSYLFTICWFFVGKLQSPSQRNMKLLRKLETADAIVCTWYMILRIHANHTCRNRYLYVDIHRYIIDIHKMSICLMIVLCIYIIYLYTDRVHTHDMFVYIFTFLEEIETLYIYIFFFFITSYQQFRKFSPQQVNTNEYLPWHLTEISTDCLAISHQGTNSFEVVGAAIHGFVNCLRESPPSAGSKCTELGCFSLRWRCFVGKVLGVVTSCQGCYFFWWWFGLFT